MAKSADVQLPPQLEERLVRLVEEIGSLRAEINDHEAVRDSAVAAAATREAKATKPIRRKLAKRQREYDDLIAVYGDQIFADVQHITLRGGHQIGRQATSEAEITGKPQAVAARLLKAGLDDLVREIYVFEPDKQSIRQLKNQARIVGFRGIRIAHFVTPWVKPAGYGVRINGRKRRLKKR